MNRIEQLLKEMSLRDKILQMTGGHYSKICDFDSLNVAHEKKNIYSDGIGVLSRLGGSNDLLPHEVAKLTNNIQKFFIEESKHKIPVLFLTEATSGTLSRGHTVFPGNMNLGAMFDFDKTMEMSSIIKKEMMSTGERLALAPVVDLARDYRFGRCEESFSEDVYLTSGNGINFIKGLQGESLEKGVAATLKHFAGQGINDGGRNTSPIHIGDREFLDQYIAPFEACIKNANPSTIMVAYHEIDGIPCHGSSKLLKEILREKLSFKGLLISDGNGLRLLHDYQEHCRTLELAAETALITGIEFEIDDVYARFLEQVVIQKPELETLVNNACKKILELKESLGLFDNPYVDEAKVNEILRNFKHLKLSYEMAKESIILLKNQNNLLPIDLSSKKIAVIGPLANEKDIGYGDYSYPTSIRETLEFSKNIPLNVKKEKGSFLQIRTDNYLELFDGAKSFLDVIKERFPASQITHIKGLKDTYNYKLDPDFCSYGDKLSVIADSDIIFFVGGDHSGMGGFSDAGESVDRVGITLPLEQQEMLNTVSKLNRPLVLVLANSRPFELAKESLICDSIIESFRAGFYSSDAIVDVITGKHNPSGRLPVTLPKNIGQLPIYYSQRITGLKQFWRNTYLEMDLDPLYEFGFGLSYSSFEYDNFTSTINANGINFSFSIRNTSEIAGSCVPQIYISKKYCSVVQPSLELKCFKKQLILPGQKIIFSGQIDFDSIGYHNVKMDYALENCILNLFIGDSAKKIHFNKTFELSFPNGIRLITNKKTLNSMEVTNG